MLDLKNDKVNVRVAIGTAGKANPDQIMEEKLDLVDFLEEDSIRRFNCNQLLKEHKKKC